MAEWRWGTEEEDQAGEEEEEEEEGFWEYDSTWEEEEEEEEGEEGEEEGGRQLEGDVGRNDSGAAPATAADDKGAGIQENPQPNSSPGWRSSFGSQEWQRPNLGSMSFRKCKNAAGRNWMAAKDMQKYRQHYPGLEETEMREEKMWNLRFYKNEMSFQPNGLLIEDLLEMWHNDYVTLEENHSYIQWLFPLREPGRNWRARLLTCQEIQAFKKSKEVMARFVRAYKLMLDFYGIELLNEKTGKLGRAENWRERFENLNRFSHNNLRITRILKCLGELGYENYQLHLVKFFLTEILVHQQLPRVLRSALDYFVFTVRNKQQRQELVHFAWRHFTPKRDFVWGPHRKLRRFKPRSPEFLNSERLEGGQDEDGEETGGKSEVEQQHKTCQRLEEEPARRESVGNDQDELLDKTGTVHPAVDQTTRNLIVEPVCKSNAELGFSSSDSVPSKVSEGEPSSGICGDGLQAGDSPGPQTSPAGEHEASAKMSQRGLATSEEVRAEKDGGKEDAAVSSFVQTGRQDLVEEGERKDGASGSSSPQLEKQDPADEAESGASGESLKECKKRKLEMSRLSEESVRVVKSPTDIEKISVNLGEVVIGQKGTGGLLLTEEKACPSLPQGAAIDGRYLKETEATDAMRKRRKVEMALEGGASGTPAEAGIEVASSETQISSASTERTDRACRDATETMGGAPTNSDCRTPGVDLLVNSKTNAPSSLSPDSCAPAQSGKQGTTAVEGKRLQASETLPFSEKEDVGGESPGQKEGGIEGKAEEVADRNEAPETVESVNSVSGPEAE
ncbi:opioid growth factor receptor [Zootoca vivipara]|uniref:opioid growth factor receptor n=1 Tax=Zootoca vivipara TaxID=8524 RepID=UPI001590D4F8|nr:opioid growth factor receptor [Zootoca vivipara]